MFGESPSVRNIWLQIIFRPFDDDGDGGGGGDNNIKRHIIIIVYIILYCDYDNAPTVPQVVVVRPCLRFVPVVFSCILLYNTRRHNRHNRMRRVLIIITPVRQGFCRT